MDPISYINGFLEKAGIQIKKFPLLDARRRMLLIRHFAINKIFDIGASTGIFGMEMRKIGFRGSIISFEPLKEPYRQLLLKTQKDTKWIAVNCAVGDSDGETIINRSLNSVSSSILDILPEHCESDPDAAFIGQENIRICRLDSVFHSYYEPGDKIYLKADTQGFEKNILTGAEKSLPHITGMQLELSIAELYKDAPGYLEMLKLIESAGFSLYSIENGFFDKKTGRLLQFDGVFFRKE